LTPDFYLRGGHFIRILGASGKRYYFINGGGNRWEGAFKEKSHLTVELDGTYTWHRTPDSTYSFTAQGQLQWIEDEHGNRQGFTYDATGKLESVTDQASARSLTFHYRTDNPALLDHISGPVTTAVSDGVWVTYGYDANNNLTSVTYADGSGFDYQYSDPNDIHNLTTKLDKMGHVLTTWSYDEYDRATTSTGRSPDESVAIEYVSSSLVKVRDAYGVTRSLTIQKQDLYYPTVTNTSDTSGCQTCGNTTLPIRYKYDKQLNVIEEEYANGRITKYENYDEQGNPGTVIDFFGTAQARSITYTYHPQTKQLMSMSEPSLLGSGLSKETTWDFDDDGNDLPNENPTLLAYRKIERGYTLDSNQAVAAYSLVTTYAYNGKGQLVSMDGPLPGDQDKTAYSYDATSGDLSTISSPLVGATTYANYDDAGNPRLITDPNSDQTILGYDGKGRVVPRDQRRDHGPYL